ncbi:hypothetical protein CEXT_681001 [Caerostris extrusa]|uniref:Uncharacterized protein n=1 Tax=Caerostris extrusa TaxID=172846 RepID=A0AAV4WQJ3_CAEEX|nr:hypothetical protein CEXT_681001 [Caerostris extrusa]
MSLVYSYILMLNYSSNKSGLQRKPTPKSQQGFCSHHSPLSLFCSFLSPEIQQHLKPIIHQDKMDQSYPTNPGVVEGPSSRRWNGVGRFEQRKVRRVDVKSELKKRDILDDGVEERRDVEGSGDIVGVLHCPGIGMLLDTGLRVGIRARSLNLNKSRLCIPTVRGLSKGGCVIATAEGMLGAGADDFGLLIESADAFCDKCIQLIFKYNT